MDLIPRKKCEHFSDGIMVYRRAVTKQEIYLDRRMGITWPGRYHPGYLCVWGLRDDRHINSGNSYVLICEEEETDRQRFFNKIAVRYSEAFGWGCRGAYAYMGDDWIVLEGAFGRYCSSIGIRSIQLHDCSEFSDFENAMPIIRDAAKRKRFFLPNGTTAREQFDIMGPESLRGDGGGAKPQEKFYAMWAVSHVMNSYEMYPWQKPVDQFAELFEESQPAQLY